MSISPSISHVFVALPVKPIVTSAISHKDSCHVKDTILSITFNLRILSSDSMQSACDSGYRQPSACYETASMCCCEGAASTVAELQRASSTKARRNQPNILAIVATDQWLSAIVTRACHCDVGTCLQSSNHTILSNYFTKSANIFICIRDGRQLCRCEERQSALLGGAAIPIGNIGHRPAVVCAVTRVLHWEPVSSHPITHFCPVTSLNLQTFVHFASPQMPSVAGGARATIRLVRDRKRQHQQLAMLLVSTVRLLSALWHVFSNRNLPRVIQSPDSAL